MNVDLYITEKLFYLGIVFAFLFGITIGSFLNVVIYRVPNNININFPPSHCPNCKHRLGPLDLFPLFSYLFLGRKCRYCSVPISPRYFTIELITGILFVCLFLCFGYSISTVIYALFVSCLICVFMIDYDTYTIPYSLIIFGVTLGIIKDIVNIILANQYAVGGMDPFMHVKIPFTSISFPMLPSICGMVVGFVIFILITLFGKLLFKKEAMGGGDTLLACVIGAVLSNTTYGVMEPIVSFFIAIFLGAIWGIVLIIIGSYYEKYHPEIEESEKNKKIKEELNFTEEEKKSLWNKPVPFGPYMVLGAFIVMFFYKYILMGWNWYYLSFLVTK